MVLLHCESSDAVADSTELRMMLRIHHTYVVCLLKIIFIIDTNINMHTIVKIKSLKNGLAFTCVQEHVVIQVIFCSETGVAQMTLEKFDCFMS